MNNDNPYSILGIQPGATDDQIQAAYHKAALKSDPVQCIREERTDCREVAQQFQRVQNAYDVLSNPVQRQLYDRYYTEQQRGNGIGNSADPFQMIECLVVVVVEVTITVVIHRIPLSDSLVVVVAVRCLMI